MTCPRDTPWGRADHVEWIAPGIYEVSTPGHGGYWLDAERLAEMPAVYKTGLFNGQTCWFEEDCDWCRVALAFPQFFPADAIAAAIQTARHFAPLALARYQADQEARYACALNSAEQNGLFGGINFRAKYPDAATFAKTHQQTLIHDTEPNQTQLL